MEVIIASRNVHKIREYRAMFAQIKEIELLTLFQFPDYRPTQEIYHTFKENAFCKAKHACEVLDKWVLADDSGLVVPKLGGAPGVHSRRYAGEGASDADNRKKLLNEMEGFVDLDRAAYFECDLAVVAPDGFEKVFTGLCEGEILTKERGRHGFGYDSLFLMYGYKESFAEVDESTKNRISHRRKAFDKLATTLEMLQLCHKVT